MKVDNGLLANYLKYITVSSVYISLLYSNNANNNHDNNNNNNNYNNNNNHTINHVYEQYQQHDYKNT